MGISKLIKLGFLVLTSIFFGGCSATDDTPSPTHHYTLTVDATKGQEESMRALTENGTSLVASWLTTENIYVKKGDTWCTGALQPQTAGTSACLSGEITGQTISVNDNLTLQFPLKDIDYTGQVGTLADIAEKFDYATATAKVTSVVGSQIYADAVTFNNQQAIVKFTLSDGTNSLPVTSLTISANGLKRSDTTTGDITITPASATSVIWTALSGVNGKVTLTAISGSKIYTYTTSASKQFTNGKYYAISVKMTEADPMLSQPLTLEATEDGNITFTNNSNGTVYYKKNNGGWTPYASTISVDANDIISFYGTGTSYYSNSEPSKITCTNDCYIYGNIMSLLEGFSMNTELKAEDTFRSLFEGNTNIQNHPTYNLLLPATTLEQNCYSYMFKGCSGLTRAPVLPAETLRPYCYQSMFENCSNLAYIKCLATTLSATDCTTDWVKNVKVYGTFVKASASSWSTGDDGIPSDWTVETQ